MCVIDDLLSKNSQKDDDRKRIGIMQVVDIRILQQSLDSNGWQQQKSEQSKSGTAYGWNNFDAIDGLRRRYSGDQADLVTSVGQCT